MRGELVPRSEGTRNPALDDGRRRALGRRGRAARPVRAAALPARRGGRRRDAAHPPPLPRPAPARDAADPEDPRRRHAHHAPLPRGSRLLGARDADADALDARGRARLPRAGAARPRQLLRAAAEPAAVQAAADVRRLRALLPDRPLLPRRGPARRPPARVHAARHRDELRRARGGARARRGPVRRDLEAGRSASRSSCRSRGSPTTRRCAATAPTSPTCATASRSATSREAVAGSEFGVFRSAVEAGGIVRALAVPDALGDAQGHRRAAGVREGVGRQGPRAPDRRARRRAALADPRSSSPRPRSPRSARRPAPRPARSSSSRPTPRRS